VAPASVDGSTLDAGPESPVRLVAFHLPQFHPIPENDLWWGEGFTEWANVVTGRPQFEGHYQPQLPTELGFYDLRDPEVLERQAELARQYGVHGFCFHHYWFGGRRVLERPLEQMLARRRPSLPFCISWANENWTRRWDGLDHDVLLRQEYEGDWAERFIRDALPVLADDRYIRVGGAALLLVYRVDLVPDAPRVAERWRAIAQTEGLDLHLAAVQSFKIGDPRPFGFDAAVEFPPHPFGRRPADARVERRRRRFRGVLEDYESMVEDSLGKPTPDYAWYRGLVPSWDNTARRGRDAYVAVGASPGAYRRWLGELARQALERAARTEPLVFVNAWNEWAEGTHLEPDDRYGRAWLEATRAGVEDGARAHGVSRAERRRALSG
jgi:lipopolysaccharide biosynthesis protein